MVFTAAQTTAFFEDADQMALPHETRQRLAVEGLTAVTDLQDFDDDTFKQLVENLRKPGGTIPDPNPQAPQGAVIPTPAFVIGAKSQTRLKTAMDIAKYYGTVNRDLTAANMRWTPVIRNFQEHWKALVDRKDEDDPDVPKISKALPVMKWAEAFPDFLQRVIGARTIPLTYVIRETVAVADPPPALAQNQPYSEEHGSVEEELIARANHTHALYREDNQSVYYYLEEATRGTSYVASIKPFQRAKDGRGAWLAIIAQYAGQDKWEAVLKKQDDLLHNNKWKGQSNFLLDRFVAQQRNAYVSMVQCADHVQFQLPNEYTRVGYLLDAIETSDAPLQAAMALIRNDTAPNGKRNDFEAAAAFLLPHDPVAKKRQTKRPHAEISGVDTPKIKSGIGSTGVEFRYHTYAEYAKLTTEQKAELHEWRKSNNETGKGKNNKKDEKNKDRKVSFSDPKKFKKMVSEVVAAELTSLDDKKKKEAAEKGDAAMGDYLISLVQADLAKASPKANAESKSPAVTVQSILRRAKNN